MSTVRVNWKPRDPILAAKLQEMSEETAAARQWSVTGKCYWMQTPAGQALHVLGPPLADVVYLAGNRFYDSALTDKTGTQITDNSTDAAKTWIKVDVSSNTVSYEDGPPPIPFPPGVEYYERAKTFGDIHITRF